MTKIIDGKVLQGKIKEDLKKRIELISDKMKLAVIQVGDDPASGV